MHHPGAPPGPTRERTRRMHRTPRTPSHRRRTTPRSTRSLRTWPLKDRPSPLRCSSTRHRRRCRIDRPRPRLRHNHTPKPSSRRRSHSGSLNRRLHRSNRCRSRSKPQLPQELQPAQPPPQEPSPPPEPQPLPPEPPLRGAPRQASPPQEPQQSPQPPASHAPQTAAGGRTITRTNRRLARNRWCRRCNRNNVWPADEAAARSAVALQSSAEPTHWRTYSARWPLHLKTAQTQPSLHLSAEQPESLRRRNHHSRRTRRRSSLRSASACFRSRIAFSASPGLENLGQVELRLASTAGLLAEPRLPPLK